jgi:hypothetical protein
MKGSKKSAKKTSPGQVLDALDQAVLDMFGKLNFGGGLPTEAQKKLGLEAVRASAGYAKIALTLKHHGSDNDLEQAKQIIQEKFPAAFRKPLLEAIKGLPHPKGGHPELLSDDTKREACDEIAKLIRVSGLERRDAIERVATHFGVSVRTMQRIWQRRKNYTTPERGMSRTTPGGEE